MAAWLRYEQCVYLDLKVSIILCSFIDFNSLYIIVTLSHHCNAKLANRHTMSYISIPRWRKLIKLYCDIIGWKRNKRPRKDIQY
jgi:hypothetical protein